MTDGSTPGTERAELASEMLDGLDAGFHYSTSKYDDDGRVVGVVWNYDREAPDPWHNDDFTDRGASERRRELAIEHQEQYEDAAETEQAKLPMTDGGTARSDGREDPPENHVSVFPWPGGKGRRSDWIIERMPPHDCFVEVFGGSAAITYNKPRSHNEVYNDVNDDLVQFFEVLRDRPDELAEWVRDVPYARSLHAEWIDDFLEGYRPDDPIERAGRFWSLRYMQFAAKPFEKSGFKVRNYWNPARTFDNAKNRLHELADRFAAVTVENRDFEPILEGYDAPWDDPDEPDVLFYLDPPYVGTEHYYSLEFDHERFVEALAAVDGRWMCSYSELPDGLADAEGVHVVARARRHRMTRSNASEATEHLVCNFDPSECGQFLASGVQQTLSVATDGGDENCAVGTDTDHSTGGEER